MGQLGRTARPTGLALLLLKRSENLIMRYIIPYFFLRRSKMWVDVSSSTFRASPSTHSPVTFPRMSQVAMRTWELLRKRFIFPVSESVRKNSSPFSSTNQTGVLTGSPVLRYVSTLMYFSPVNWDHLSPVAFSEDWSAAGMPLGNADGVSYTN
jgi:hypothetical protein